MPYRQVYEPAPKNMSLKVIEQLPEGYEEDRLFSFAGVKVYRKSGSYDYLTKCHRCKGFIEGLPNEFQVNTLDTRHLAGRQGTEYYCQRCGSEIGFIGMMS